MYNKGVPLLAGTAARLAAAVGYRGSFAPALHGCRQVNNAVRRQVDNAGYTNPVGGEALNLDVLVQIQIRQPVLGCNHTWRKARGEPPGCGPGEESSILSRHSTAPQVGVDHTHQICPGHGAGAVVS